MMNKARRWWWVALVLVLASGCTTSGGTGDDAVIRPAGGEESSDDDLDGLPTEGQVCRSETRTLPADSGAAGAASSVVTCGEGLDCCYPCGMAGCDWVCATPENCESWRALP